MYVQINDNVTIEQMKYELAQACFDGLKDLEIHNQSQPMNMEISLLCKFCGLYGISNEQISAVGLGNIRKFNKQTINIDKNYGQASSNSERKLNPWILTKTLRYHNQIDLQDGFILLEIQEKGANEEYEYEEQIIMDLTRLLVYFEGEIEDIYDKGI
ncbi:MAG: hypothetical protein EZS28_006593 [Streblomastix strix]|uniref:Uncharacterized protein n=1 Tax=Streblomastix strix TaxID=222440 RepID=A0A5J4WSI7_9EUKA|nr:MAG: hypothetical protein EZS28_006593 [Streblomastix strix]